MTRSGVAARAFPIALGVSIFAGSTLVPAPVGAVSVEWSLAAGGNGHLYEAVAAPAGISWDDAQLAAVMAGGYLATIASAEENAFVYGLVAGEPGLWVVDGANNTLGPWLGGIQPPGSAEPAGGFEWVTGEPFSFSNFLPGQPDNAFENEEAIDFFGYGPDNHSPGWNDLPRDVPLVFGYVVESEPALPAALIPGGGPTKSDCYAELSVVGIENPSAQVEKSKKVLCTDGEACDRGPCGDLRCDVRLRLCVNQQDSNLPDCTAPSGLESVKVKSQGKVKLDVAAPQLLEGAQCGPSLDGTIPVRVNKKGKAVGAGKAKIKIDARAPKGTKPRPDSDTVTIQCVPRTVDCPSG